MTGPVPDAARRAAERFAALPAVEAVALGGSAATGLADAGSDADLYVYAAAPLAPADRQRAVAPLADGPPVRVVQWGDEDAWTDSATGTPVEAIYWETGWIEDELDRVLHRHEARLGYSTALWFTVRVSRPLFDRRGWFAALQAEAARPYPPALRRSVLALNRPTLRGLPASYRHQLVRAAARGDRVALNHRAAAFLASYFDGLFAANLQPHPGEKRLLEHAERLCPHRPESLREDVGAFLDAASVEAVGAAADRLADDLDQTLDALGLLSDAAPALAPLS